MLNRRGFDVAALRFRDCLGDGIGAAFEFACGADWCSISTEIWLAASATVVQYCQKVALNYINYALLHILRAYAIIKSARATKFLEERKKINI